MNDRTDTTTWFAWDGDRLTPLGEHEDIEGAWEKADRLAVPVNWVFSREALLDFVADAQEVLK